MSSKKNTEKSSAKSAAKDVSTARNLLLKSRIYRFVAVVFAMVGVAIFVVIYLQKIEGNLFLALRDPLTVGVLLFPFIPAAVLSWMAIRTEKRLLKLVEQRKAATRQGE